MSCLFVLALKKSSDSDIDLYLDLIKGWWPWLLMFAFLWGYVTMSIARNKGYDEKEKKAEWFLIGFLLGVIGVIFAACQPTASSNTSSNGYSNNSNVPSIGNGWWKCVCGDYNPPNVDTCICGMRKNLASSSSGTWKCSCGRYNSSYVGTCSCGRNKAGYLRSDVKTEKNTKKPSFEGDGLDQLKKLKELLDMGAITQEEYDIKKKEILKI